ncbi:hypothetical protein [Okeania sp. SIO3B5]|nr:hypothetical protein [Okeania sp. SIO3B5]
MLKLLKLSRQVGLDNCSVNIALLNQGINLNRTGTSQNLTRVN